MTESAAEQIRVNVWPSDMDQNSPAKETMAPISLRSSNSPLAAGIWPPSSSNLFRPTTIGDLPDSALVDILIRLPDAKSATICKCVTKRWLSVIAHSYFINRFVSHHSIGVRPCCALIFSENLTRTHVVPVHTDPWFVSSIPAPFEGAKQPPMRVVASCNDLLLCSPDFRNLSSLFICNPFTMEVVQVPPMPPPFPGLIDNLFGIICEPYNNRKSRKVASITSYKVVIFNNQNRSSFSASVFSSETGTWCKSLITSRRGLPVLMDFDLPIVCCNDKLYWWCNSMGGKPAMLASCKLNNPGHFTVISPPAGFESENSWRICRADKFRIGVYMGRILVFKLVFKAQVMLYVWELMDFERREWKTVHTLRLSEVSFPDLVLYEMIAKGQVWLVSKHSDNEDIVYLGFTTHACSSDLGSTDQLFACSISEKKAMRVAGKLPPITNSVYHEAFTLSLPRWPTTIPK